MLDNSNALESPESNSAPRSSHCYAAWLDRHATFKRHHTGPVPVPALNGKRYECDFWYFVIEDYDSTETPAIALRVSHEPIADYMEVNVENMLEDGTVESSAFLGLFSSVNDLRQLIDVLVRVNLQ